MSEAKHTKGPWRLEADPAHFDSLTTVTGGQRMNARPHAWPAYPLTVQVGGMATLHEMQANARLIAAAPDLLEVLKHIRRCIPYGGFVQIHDNSMTLAQIDAAIAKAEGGAA